MIYAPVLITTLNRYDCLKKCIESLKKNKWADKTDIYISVDYPISDHYRLGYKKVREYLLCPIYGFKSCTIFFHEHNLGVCENMEWLVNKVTEKYDNYIFLEDDMEVAPGFLEFCDKGLELFENDPSIIAINASDYVWCGQGYTPPVRKVYLGECNVEKRQLLFHGAAFWKKKANLVTDFWKNTTMLYKPEYILKIYRCSRTFFYTYLDKVLLQKKMLPWHKGKLVMIDMMWDYYMMINEKYVVNPILPLLRDLGVDGNGVNYTEKFSNAIALKTRDISMENEFEYRNINLIKINENELVLHDKFDSISALDKIRYITKTCIFFLKKDKGYGKK